VGSLSTTISYGAHELREACSSVARDLPTPAQFSKALNSHSFKPQYRASFANRSTSLGLGASAQDLVCCLDKLQVGRLEAFVGVVRAFESATPF